MSWTLKGSYVETCSCELMCPCNLSFDHGATYDFCRVTLVFNIREGEIDGTDIGGLKVAAIADTPKVMTEGNWRLGMFVDERATDEQADKLVQVFSGQLGGPMAGLAPLVGEMLGVERATIEVDDDGLRHSVRIGDAIDFEIEDIVPFGVETGEPVRFDGMFHPVASEPHDGGGEALADQRLRHPVRGQDRALDVRVLLGRLSRDRLRADRSRRRRRRSRSGLRGRARPARARRPALRPRRRSAGGGRSTGCGAWTTAPGPALGTLGWFLGIWVVMMAAMMFPSVAPTVALYSRMTRERSPLSPLALRRGLSRRLGGGRRARVRDRARRGADRRRRARVGSRGPLGRRGDAPRRGRLRADAAQGRLPREVPQPARASCSARGATAGRARYGWAPERRLVRRLLLGADGVAVRARGHEHRSGWRSSPG